MGDPGMWGFALTGILMAVLAYGATRLAGRLGRPAGSGHLQVLEALPLGRDRTLYLIRVGGAVLVVGSAPGGIALVHTPDPGEVPLPPPAAPEPFARWLERLAARGRRPGGDRDA